MGKLIGAFLCLGFAVPFGGVGVFATWAIGKTLWDAHRAAEWILVKAEVVDPLLSARPAGTGAAAGPVKSHYAYTFEGKRYESRRIGIGALDSGDDIDDWREAMGETLRSARAAGKSLSVWVNPDNPAEAVFDREIPWEIVLLLAPFSIAFSAIGIGALWAAVRIARKDGGRDDGSVRTLARGSAGGNQGAGFLWVFAILWNAVAFPAAFLVLPDIIASREWAGLFVLLFPFVGVLLIWGAVSATLGAIKARFAGSSRGASPRQSGPRQPVPQATHGLFDSPVRSPTGPEAFKGVDLPASVARITVQGGVLTVRFSRRRWLAPAAIVFAVGGVLTLVGVFMILDEGIGVGTVLLLVVASAVDLGGVALLASSLEVRARAGEIAVEKGGLFGSKSWQLRRESIKSIRPVLSYTANNVPYFSVRAETRAGEQVTLGDSLKGESLAEKYASRLAAAAAFPSSLVRTIAYPGEPDA